MRRIDRFRTDETGRTVVKVCQIVRNLEGKVMSENLVEQAYRPEEGLIKRMGSERLNHVPADHLRRRSSVAPPNGVEKMCCDSVCSEGSLTVQERKHA